METKFLICKHCGNIVEVIRESGVSIVCCGEKMSELKANTTDGAIVFTILLYKLSQFLLF